MEPAAAERPRATAGPDRAPAPGASGPRVPRPGAGYRRPVSEPERTPDGHHVVIDGRRWRASDPALPEEERRRHVDALMAARRDVGTAKRRADAEAERAARDRVQAAKVALGERGPKWWEDEDERRAAHDEAVATLEGSTSAGARPDGASA